MASMTACNCWLSLPAAFPLKNDIESVGSGPCRMRLVVSEFPLNIKGTEKSADLSVSQRWISPPPPSGHSDFMQVLFLHIKIYMFSKQEKPDMVDFERKKYFEMSKFLSDTLAKISQNIFAYSTASEHSKHFFFIF